MSDTRSPSSDPDVAETLRRINQAFSAMVPFNHALGLSAVDYGPGFAVMRLPYDARFVGNPDLGVLHGGAITALVDATCGMSVFIKLEKPIPIATLDLRIDYLRPAEPGRDVLARADCYKATRNVCFVRAVAYHDDLANPIASAAGSFMISTPGRTVMEHAEPFAIIKERQGT